MNKEQKVKTQKSIVLGVLVITIIVLIILAVDIIGEMQNHSIINYANVEYNAGEKNTVLESNLSKIEENAPSESSAKMVELYGQPVIYSKDLNGDGNLSNDWKVFYAEGDYVYIIASDYLQNTLIPNGENALNMSKYSTYGAYWILGSNFRSTGSETITNEVASKYKLSWLDLNVDANGVRINNSNWNARAVGDLLNENVWTEAFGDSTKGIKAIGAPTLEMWVASWNAKGEKEGRDKYEKLYTTSNTTGYFVGNQEKSTAVNYYVGTRTYGYDDELYFPHTSAYKSCYGYWLASPSGYAKYLVLYVRYDGYIYYYTCSYSRDYCAARPLVSLPSNLLVKNADGGLIVKVDKSMM